jgi:signal peptidase I
MRISLTPKQMVSGALTLGTLATAWVLLAPIALGGEATYVVTDGISMQPRFHAGDLAIVHAESGYHVGEIVAYRSRLLHTIILHRIIGMEGDRYIFKGDNNDFVDLEHPTRSQLVGRLWLHVPGLGSHLGPLRRRGSVALAVMFGLLLFLSSLFTKKQLRRKRLRAARAPTFRLRLPTRAPSGPVVGFGVAVALAGLLTVVAFTKPSRAPAPFAVPYTQSGTFAYSATTTPGAAYPDGRVTTGDPLFLRLVRSADVGFSYRFASSADHRVAGTIGLTATLASSTGWMRTFTLAKPQRFSGNRASVRGTIDLSSFAALVAHLETTTQVRSSYTFTLTPLVRIVGAVSGSRLSAVYTPQLGFSLDANELQPTLPGAVGHPSTPDRSNPLKPSASGSVSATKMLPASFAILGKHLTVSAMRVFSLVCLFAALCFLAGFGIGDLLGHRMHGTEADSILSRYRNLLVQVVHVRDPSTQRVVVVSDMAALGRIAERYDRMILHEKVAGQDAYFVADDGVLYRYEAAGTRPTLVADVSSVAQAG